MQPNRYDWSFGMKKVEKEGERDRDARLYAWTRRKERTRHNAVEGRG